MIHSEHAEGRAWLKSATARQLAELRSFGVDGPVDADVLADVKRLAAANPGVDLFVDSKEALSQLLPLFKPAAVFGPEDVDAAAWRSLLADQRQIEMLIVEADEPGTLDVLSALPNLKTLVISNWDVQQAGSLPAGLTSLSTLIVVEGHLADVKPLGAVAGGLETLTLFGADDFTDVAGLAGMTGLHTLVLSSDGIADLAPLATLKNLRWVAFPKKTSPEQFAAFVAAHPKLGIVDMMGNDAVKDLAPLGTLEHLQGLLLDGPYDDLSAVQKLTSLRYVGVSGSLWDRMPDQVAALQKALPDALVVRVKPLCLGSGWLLLLIPVPFVVEFIRRRRWVSVV
jgi:hypothetical protein